MILIVNFSKRVYCSFIGNKSKYMYFIRLIVKDKTLPQHTFLFMYLFLLPNDEQMEWPKHVLGKEFKEHTDFKCSVYLDLNRYCYFLFDNIFWCHPSVRAYDISTTYNSRNFCATCAMFVVDSISSTLQLYSHSLAFNLETQDIGCIQIKFIRTQIRLCIRFLSTQVLWNPK